MISVQDLNMTYKAPIRDSGFKAALQSIIHRRYKEVNAVKSINLMVTSGEILGFIGPNGAGKTTTLKILSGILHPTSGKVEVLGFVPWKRQYNYLRQIAMIRGSRPIAVPGELTVEDAFRLQKRIYGVEDPLYRRNVSELCDMLDIHNLLQRQVRALSLGERMRSGIAWSLLYRPKVLFLDEPTIGLDVSATQIMRNFIKQYCGYTGASAILTSHYMGDVESLCRRVALVDQGQILHDGLLEQLSSKLAPYRLVKVVTTSIDVPWSEFGDIVARGEGQVTLRIPTEQVTAVVSMLLNSKIAQDLTVQEPPLETVIDQVYRKEKIV